MWHFRRPLAPQDPFRVAVVFDQLFVFRLLQLFGDRQPLAHVDRLAVGGVAVGFPEVDVGRFGRLIEPPGDGADGVGERAIDQHHFAGGILNRGDAGQDVASHARGAVEGAVFVNVAVVSGWVTDLRVVGVGTNRFGFAVLEKARAFAPHEVDIPFDVTIGDVGLAVNLQCILETDEIEIRKHGTGIG